MDEKLIIGTMCIKVDDNGNADLTSTLIDPYGIITDAATGKTIDGADVTLYYANTEKNKAAGKIPDTVVKLLAIDGFKPNNNKNPQISAESGIYGFMVFPNTDYYITSTKDGYNKYISPTISVEQKMVKWDFKINKVNLTRPVITLVGSEEMTTKLHDTYIDAGATAVDGNGKDITSKIVVSNNVDADKIGEYTITYNVIDSDGNAADSVKRIVNVAGIERLSGKTKTDTAIEIAEAAHNGKISNIILATAEDYPDALTGSVLAYKLNAPILLVGNSKDDEEKILTYMKEHMDYAGAVYILGGTGAVSMDMEMKITASGFKNIKRIGGTDRYETAAKIADELKVSEGTPIILCIRRELSRCTFCRQCRSSKSVSNIAC